MKETAVEWLENQIKNSKYFYNLMEDINSRSTIAQSNIFEQAKEMEKEQMIQCYEDGYNRVAKLIEDAAKQNDLTFKSE